MNDLKKKLWSSPEYWLSFLTPDTCNKSISFSAHSCWKQWMRYWEADVDGSCRLWTEVISHATPSHLEKVKDNFSETQKLTHSREHLYGSIKIKTSNHISKLLKMQLESRSQNVHDLGTHCGFISTHAVITQKSISGSHIGKSCICVHLQLV